MEVNQPLSLEELAQAYVRADQEELSNVWLKVEIAAEVELRDNNERETNKGESKIAETFISTTKEAASTYRQYVWLGQKYPDVTSRKIPVTYTHFRAAAKTEDPMGWVTKAYENNWSTRAMIQAIDEAKAAVDTPAGALCACGCGLNAPNNSPPTISGLGDKRRYVFATIPCLLRFAAQWKVSMEATTYMENVTPVEVENLSISKDIISHITVASHESDAVEVNSDFVKKEDWAETKEFAYAGLSEGDDVDY